ncbi:hypothetical protein BHE74_00050526 [Ensete ventricosum]|nr:hypothetical protein GW17_00043229 [Ensete ventricosum]RWW43775.1 hypothetical protein BHE74_00050526 [Ensete ventricosum]
MITFATIEICSEDKMEKLLLYVKIRTCSSNKVWVVEFYQIFNSNAGGSGRLIDLRLGVEDEGDVLKQLWELLGWVEVAEMVAGTTGTRMEPEFKHIRKNRVLAVLPLAPMESLPKATLKIGYDRYNHGPGRSNHRLLLGSLGDSGTIVAH